MKIDAKMKRKSMIQVKGGFSDTTGIAIYNKSIQITEFDDRTRMILSNNVFDMLVFFFEKKRGHYKDISYSEPDNDFCKTILSDVFAKRTALKQGYSFDWRWVYDNNIHLVFQDAPYNEVLDIIWYICDWLNENYILVNDLHYDTFNSLFERESIGYRFVCGDVVPITDKQEIKEIEEAATSEFEGCRRHIKNAVALLADREYKDYKNCIKESISAVESVCKIIIQRDNATLGDALKVLESKRGLKGPLKAAFEKLYAYTNDKGGIRHAEGLFVSDVSFEEAKFMLVSCSAFVNYVIAEYGKIDS